MYKQKLGFIALTLLLSCARATAGDPAPAAKDAHAAPAKESPKEAAPAKDAHAATPKDAHAAEAKEAAKGAAKEAKEVKEASKEAAPAKDTHTADSHDAAASKDEPKPVVRKAKRKKAKAEAKPEAKAQAKGHGDANASADHHADAAPAVPASIEPTTRVRPRDRTSAASAVAAEQSAGAHDAHSDSHAAAPVAAKQDANGARSDARQADTHAAPAAAAKPDAHGAKANDAHHADAAPSAPAPIEPTQRQRVKSPVATTEAPASRAAHADAAAHDDHPAADAHGNSSHAAPDAKHAAPDAKHAAPDAKHAAKDSGGHDAHHDAKSQDAHAASAHAGDECNLPLKAEIAALFDRWNASLRTGDPKKVVANYAPDSVLLPTVSNRARFTIAEKEDYFMHFLQRRPQGYIDDRMIDVDCNSATDAGLYTFRFADGSSVKARYSFSYKKINGQWLITSHHSSGMPEKPAASSAVHADTHAAPKTSDPGSSTKGWVRFP